MSDNSVNNYNYLYCPNCEEALNANSITEKIVCPYCGNLIVPVEGNSLRLKEKATIEYRTPLSTGNYMEQYFEEFDWNTFALDSSTYRIPQITLLVENNKITSSNDKLTWQNEFTSIIVPVTRKIDYLSRFNKRIAILYLEKPYHKELFALVDNTMAVINMLKTAYNDIIGSLITAVNNAKALGLTEIEANKLNLKIDTLKASFAERILNVSGITDILEVKEAMLSRDKFLLESYSEKNIDLESEYQKNIDLYQKNKNNQAVALLLSLGGYKDSFRLVTEINHYNNNYPIIEMGQKLYYAEPNEKSQFFFNQSFKLYQVIDERINHKELINDLKKVISVCGNKFFYFDSRDRIIMYDLETKAKKKIDKKGGILDDLFFVNNLGTQIYFKQKKPQKWFLLRFFEKFKRNKIFNPNPYRIVKLDLVNHNLEEIYPDVMNLYNYINEKIYFSLHQPKIDKKGNLLSYGKLAFYYYDIKECKEHKIIDDDVVVRGILPNDYIVYTKSVGKNNYNLYTKKTDSQDEAILIERNIYEFHSIIKDKIVYIVGNNNIMSLFINQYDGGDRKQIMKYMKEVLYKENDWMYILQGDENNSALIRVNIDGIRKDTLISGIAKIVKIAYGYIFYLDSYNCLSRIKLDGSNQLNLERNIKEIILIKDNIIYYTTVDGTKETIEGVKELISLYSMNSSDMTRRKVAYDIISALAHDYNYIDYYKYTIDDKKELIRFNCTSLEYKSLLIIEKIDKRCYIATSVYGSADCDEVMTLRRYRDSVLINNLPGRLLVKVYYLISPTMVKLFGRSRLFTKVSRKLLDRKIIKINKKK